MGTNKEVSRLSAFVTLKRLYNGKKTKNAVLSEFIYYVLIKDCKYVSFSSKYIKERLEDYFGFNIPLGVIENTLCRMDSISKATKDDNPNEIEYIAKSNSIKTSEINSDSQQLNLINTEFRQFCSDNHYHYDKTIFEESLCKFLLDERLVESIEMKEAISLFISSKESNSDSIRILKEIKEGAILYLGLNYDVPSVKKNIKLTLYLDMEVIFDLAGYNGELYKELATEFVSLIRNLNNKGHKIILRTFPEIDREIDSFFSSAEAIVSGKSDYYPRIAMRSIIDGCKEPSDVQMKKALLKKTLNQEYGIEIDHTDFYVKDLDVYNLETNNLESNIDLDDLRFISHVNKLRKGKECRQLLNSNYIFVTETGSLLSTSEAISKKQGTCEYAVRMGFLTNMLWYYQCHGLGGAFPKNADIAIQAKTVLSRIIDTNVFSAYDEAKCSDFSPEDVDIFIESFHSIPVLPEQINQENGMKSVKKSKERIDRFFKDIERERASHSEIKKRLSEKETENKKLFEEKTNLESTVSSIERDKADLELSFEETKEKKNQEVNKAKRTNHWLVVLLVSLIVYIIVDKLGLAAAIAKLFTDNWGKLLGYCVDLIISIIGGVITYFITNRGFRKKHE